MSHKSAHQHTAVVYEGYMLLRLTIVNCQQSVKQMLEASASGLLSHSMWQ